MRFQSKMICLRSDSCKLTAKLEIKIIVSQYHIPTDGMWAFLFFFLKMKTLLFVHAASFLVLSM